MVVCALIPRLSLRSALADREELLGRPVALAPEPGGPQVIGETSGAAEAFGLRVGMRLGEALSRCPNLSLVAADPVRATAVWEQSLRRLEAIGAAVEAPGPGEAFFATAPLHGICGPKSGGSGGRGVAEAVLARARRALGPPAKLGAGPNRLCAREAAARMRARRAAIVVSEGAAARLLAEMPVASLRGMLHRRGQGRGDAAGGLMAEATCIDSLERLGVLTLGELAALPADAISDRFGRVGLRALGLARGGEESLRPRRPGESVECRLELPEAASGPQLEHALGLLIDRLLAHKERAARTIRRLRLEARLAAGGGWYVEVAMRSASSSAERLRLALIPRLAELPGPATWLGLRAVELGPPAGEQRSLAASPSDERRGRIVEAVRQARAAGGRDALLRVVEVDRSSRVPERRAILAPFLEPKRK
jgi:protein ImuB